MDVGASLSARWLHDRRHRAYSAVAPAYCSTMSIDSVLTHAQQRDVVG